MYWNKFNETTLESQSTLRFFQICEQVEFAVFRMLRSSYTYEELRKKIHILEAKNEAKKNWGTRLEPFFKCFNVSREYETTFQHA